MLVMTVQKKSVSESIMKGNYKANFWKSDYSCVSPSYTRGYSIIKKNLENKLGIELSEEDTPIWSWVGVPYLDFHKGVNDEDNLVAMFVDTPEKELVFSDYDKYCKFIWGDVKSTDFMVDSLDGIDLESDEMCIQACFLKIKPENVVLTVDFVNFKDVELKSIERFYNYWNLVSIYLNLRKSYETSNG